uniref:Uncharacterized protein n=1 Tax=Anopheles quadriannulatus TaxID=34691 RepID=A0A182XT43_ANOQN
RPPYCTRRIVTINDRAVGGHSWWHFEYELTEQKQQYTQTHTHT